MAEADASGCTAAAPPSRLEKRYVPDGHLQWLASARQQGSSVEDDSI